MQTPHMEPHQPMYDEGRTLRTVQRFAAAFNRHDVDTMMSLMTDDCVFENTYPPPSGERFVGHQALRAFWEKLFRASPNGHFAEEELFVCGDRAIFRWMYTWKPQSDGFIRGVDILRIVDGKIAEKLSYVKG